MTCLSAFMPSFSSIKYDFSPLFLCVYRHSICYVLLGWRGWQVIALHEFCLCWMFNMYQKKSLNMLHTNLCEQWNTNRFDASDLKCLFANCASIRLHWLTESIVILSCTRVWYVFVCGFQTIQPHHSTSLKAHEHTHAYTPFHFISFHLFGKNQNP